MYNILEGYWKWAVSVPTTSAGSVTLIQVLDGCWDEATGWMPECVTEVWEEGKYVELVILKTTIPLDFQRIKRVWMVKDRAITRKKQSRNPSESQKQPVEYGPCWIIMLNINHKLSLSKQAIQSLLLGSMAWKKLTNSLHINTRTFAMTDSWSQLTPSYKF